MDEKEHKEDEEEENGEEKKDNELNNKKIKPSCCKKGNEKSELFMRLGPQKELEIHFKI